MAHTAPVAPFTALHSYVKSAPGMRGIRVLDRARGQADEGAPPRVIMFPTTGPIEASADDGETLTDALIAIECHCWGQDHDRLWDVIRRLLDTVRRYRLDEDIEIQWNAVDFDTEIDTNRDGDAATVTLTMRAGLDVLDLTGEGGEGDVEAVRYQPDPDDDDAFGPTVNQTE